MAIVAPPNLLTGSGLPRRFAAVPESLSEIARRHDCKWAGPDIPISSFLPLSALSRLEANAAPLTYLSAVRFADGLHDLRGVVVVTKPDLRHLVPDGNAVLLCEGSPHDMFYTLLTEAIEQRRFETLPSHISSSADVSPHAFLAEGVYVDHEAVIGPGAVVLGGTYVGRGVVIKPNATVGGDGFENAVIANRRRIVPHAGGVWIAEGANVGSSTCLDKGLFGDFTYVGAYTNIDNLVHFAHAATCGTGCSLVACCEVSGSVRLGDGVWVGPSACINQRLTVGSHCYIGSGSVVTRNLPAYSLAYGSPAKIAAQVCACRAKLQFVDGRAACEICGNRYRLTVEGVVIAA